MDATPKPVAKKTADIQVLRCLNPECRGLLAYEVNSENVLYVDLAWTAKSDGTLRYFPCPRCNGKNVVEARRTDKGQVKHVVTRREAGVATREGEPVSTEADRRAEERLELMPRAVRDKLDRAGIKLHLKQWQLLPMADRERLRDLPCLRADEIKRYTAAVEDLVIRLTGKPPDRIQSRP